MKKVLIVVLSLAFLVIPSFLDAKVEGLESMNLKEALEQEGIEPKFEEYTEDDNQTIIYIFRGEGEEKSVAFLNYLNDIYAEYGRFFKVVSYEVGSNYKNSELMDNVIDYLSSSITTVPFILIGDMHFTTYNEDLNENIIKAIVSNYESSEKIDTVQEVMLKYYRNYDLIIWIIIIAIFAFVGVMVYASIKGNKE